MNTEYMTIKTMKERVRLSSNEFLRKGYLIQVAVQIVETFKLHFYAMELAPGLEVDFDKLFHELKELINEDSYSITVLALSAHLIEYEVFEIRAQCMGTGDIWNPLNEPFVCFIARAIDPKVSQRSKPTLHLNDIASWIDKKICLNL